MAMLALAQRATIRSRFASYCPCVVFSLIIEQYEKPHQQTSRPSTTQVGGHIHFIDLEWLQKFIGIFSVDPIFEK